MTPADLHAFENLLSVALLVLIVLMIMIMLAVALAEQAPRRFGFIVRRIRDHAHDRRIDRLIAQLNRRAVQEAREREAARSAVHDVREREAARRLDAGT